MDSQTKRPTPRTVVVLLALALAALAGGNAVAQDLQSKLQEKEQKLDRKSVV